MKPEDVPDGPLLVDTDVVSYWFNEADRGEAFAELVAGRRSPLVSPPMASCWPTRIASAGETGGSTTCGSASAGSW